MSDQARIDALEYLVVALIKELKVRSGLPGAALFDSAKVSLLDSDGPGGPSQKAAAVQALEYLNARSGVTM